MSDCSRAQCGAQGYILQNQVTHSRLLPAASKHSFVYPTLSFLLSLDALESHRLDLLRGWLFGYGGVYGRVTGMRSSAYLYDDPHDTRSIRQKLEAIINERGWPAPDLRDAWLMTMPSFLCFEGINPLTVYFCYRHGSSALWLVVLEIHNTFGERNVHVLETGKAEDIHPNTGFDHQWTFPRQFHVSPFNDRSGHYVCQVTAPSHPPFPGDKAAPLRPPRPIVKITLLTASPQPQKKLVAILRATESVPFSSMSLLSSLARAPFVLLLSFPRILYQAYHLHYNNRLDVYRRPEPIASRTALEADLPTVFNPAQLGGYELSGGIGWQAEGVFEKWCKNRVHAFLRRRCAETGTIVTITSASPFDPLITISPHTYETRDKNELSIIYRTPRLFTILFTMPSPQHALLYGSQAENVFSVSSPDLFINIFSPPQLPSTSSRYQITHRLMRRIRKALVPSTLNIALPSHHVLDEPGGFIPVFVLTMLWFLAAFERRAFTLLGARFVPGDEPWGGWERLHSANPGISGEHLGSVRRERCP